VLGTVGMEKVGCGAVGVGGAVLYREK